MIAPSSFLLAFVVGLSVLHASIAANGDTDTGELRVIDGNHLIDELQESSTTGEAGSNLIVSTPKRYASSGRSLQEELRTTVPVFLKIRLDSKPQETHWRLVDMEEKEEVMSVPAGHYTEPFERILERFELTAGKRYKLVMKDTAGDGLDGFYYDLSYGGVYPHDHAQAVIEKVENFGKKHVTRFVAREVQTFDDTPCVESNTEACVTLHIKLDDYPEELTWELMHVNEWEAVEYVLPGVFRDGQVDGFHQWTLIPGATYFLTMRDTYGDGLSSPDGYIEVYQESPNGKPPLQLMERVTDFNFGYKRLEFTVPGSNSAGRKSRHTLPHEESNRDGHHTF